MSGPQLSCQSPQCHPLSWDRGSGHQSHGDRVRARAQQAEGEWAAVPGSWGGATVGGGMGLQAVVDQEGHGGHMGQRRRGALGRESPEKVLEASSGVGKAGAAGVSPGTEVRRSTCSQWGDKKLGVLPGSRAPGGAMRGRAVAPASQGRRWRWGQGRGRDKGRGEWGQLVTQKADQGAAGPGWAKVGQQEGPAGPGTTSRLSPGVGLCDGWQGLV